MNVQVRLQFAPPTKEDFECMRVLADSLTSDRKSVKVYAEAGRTGWLVADFQMQTQAQYQALPAIEQAIRLYGWRRMESTIAFPRSPEEEARAERKLARARARRHSRTSFRS